MKKVILSAFCLFSSLALVGCGGVSDAEVNKNVNLQLDRVNSVVSHKQQKRLSRFRHQTTLPMRTIQNFYLSAITAFTTQKMRKS